MVLDNALYKINLDNDDSNPLTTLMMLKLNEAEGGYQTTQLKQGNYQIKSVKEKNTIYKFTIDEKGLFQGSIHILGDKNGTMTVKNSTIQLVELDANDTYIKAIPNRQDSLTVASFYEKENNFKKQEITVFFTKKDYKKAILKEYHTDGSYFEINEITGKNKYANKDGKEIIQDQDKDDVEAVESPPSRFYFPFAYKGKWGVVNKDNDEYIQPTYDGAYFPNDFSFILLTQKDGISVIINCFTGEEISGSATYKSSVLLDDKEYLFFTDGKKSELIYLPDEDTKKLSKPYIYLGNPPNDSSNNKEYKNYLIATLPNKQDVLLNKNDFSLALPNSYLEIGSFLDYAQSNEKEYIYTIDENQKVTIYSPKLEEVMKLKMKNIHQFTEKELHQISKKLKFKQLYYTTWGKSMTSVSIMPDTPKDISYTSRFKVDAKSPYVFYKAKNGKEYEVYFNNKNKDVHFIYFGEKRKKTYIYIPPNYTKNTPLLLPKKYWD